MVVEKAHPKAVFIVKLILKLLSYRFGTLLLCGYGSFGWKWPFLLKFSEISLHNRERILQNWSASHHKYTVLLRMAFMIIKMFCCFKFFSRVSLFSFSLVSLLLLEIGVGLCSMFNIALDDYDYGYG